MVMDEIEEGRFVWTCEECGKTATCEGGFRACWKLLKSKGWIAIKISDSNEPAAWSHSCGCRPNLVKVEELMSRPYGIKGGKAS